MYDDNILSYLLFLKFKNLCFYVLDNILIYGKINFMLAIKITVPKTIFNVLFEK